MEDYSVILENAAKVLTEKEMIEFRFYLLKRDSTIREERIKANYYVIEFIKEIRRRHNLPT